MPVLPAYPTQRAIHPIWSGRAFCVFRVFGVIALALFASALHAAEIDDAWLQFRQGDYAGALRASREAQRKTPRNANEQLESWVRLEVEVMLMRGDYVEASKRLNDALTAERTGAGRFRPPSIRLRLLAREAALFSQRAFEADQRLREIVTLLNSPRRGADGDALAAIGEAALLLGAEPRLALENFFKRAQQLTPPSRDGFLGAGRLALDKHDYALASRTFQEGLKQFPEDPDLWAGLAASFLDGDRAKLIEYAGRALAIDKHHIRAHLLLAEHAIDAEDYALATRELASIRAINPRRPEALALLAVIAHLRNDDVTAAQLRGEALATWRENPWVDHLIGRKLAQKYRFNEGAAAQQRALAFDAKFVPARLQLAQDLLRLGRDDEGWAAIEQAQKADAYDVTAFNLVALRDRLKTFTTLSSPHFRLRMSPAEARIYGDRALALLEDARVQLTTKYGLKLNDLTTVEIYPDPKDFAVRTFGMPDNPGYLGVCFGALITANSPAAQRANWEAVLWHEFCHTVTLTLTRNRMPRWLSEGISVYEERQRNSSWGQRMSLDARERILGGKMPSISRMSSAFLQAKDSKDLQFAYFQSSLVVEFLAERHGLEKIKALLGALYAGSAVDPAIAQTIAPLDELERDFAKYAEETAKKLGGGLDLSRPGPGIAGAFAELNPRNYHVRLQEARRLAEEKNWAEAKAKLLDLTSGRPYLPGADNAHALLARVCAELGDVEGERAAWQTMAERESDALPAVTRLLALAEQAQDWAGVARWGETWLAISPLSPAPWRALLTAYEHLNKRDAAVVAGRTLLELAPNDVAAVHLRVAKQLAPIDVTGARRHVLLSLAEAPRYLAAYELLRSLPETSAVNNSPVPMAAPAPVGVPAGATP